MNERSGGAWADILLAVLLALAFAVTYIFPWVVGVLEILRRLTNA